MFAANLQKMKFKDTVLLHEYAFFVTKYAAARQGAAVPFDDGEPITDVHSACARLKRKGLKALAAESGLETPAAPRV